VAIDPTEPPDVTLRRLRRVRRVALSIGSLVAVLLVLALRRCG
jgi:hypothetical protein